MRFIPLITLLSLLLLSCQSGDEKARTHLKSGLDYLYAGDNDKALNEFDAAVNADPEDPEAYFYRGNAWFNKRETENAIADFSKAIELDPNYADAWFNRGNIYFFLGDKDQACRDWKMAESLGKPNVGDKTRFCP